MSRHIPGDEIIKVEVQDEAGVIVDANLACFDSTSSNVIWHDVVWVAVIARMGIGCSKKERGDESLHI